MVQVLRLDAQMQKLAEELKHENSLLVFGRGYNYATALEAALKVLQLVCSLRCTQAVPHQYGNKHPSHAFQIYRHCDALS